MALPGWPENTALGRIPCTEERDRWQCPNMKEVDGDLDMRGEHYVCKVCGKREFLDYEEMR